MLDGWLQEVQRNFSPEIRSGDEGVTVRTGSIATVRTEFNDQWTGGRGLEARATGRGWVATGDEVGYGGGEMRSRGWKLK